MMLNFEEYANKVAEDVREKLGKGFKVRVRILPRNNGERSIGVEIQEKGKDVYPVINLDEFYDRGIEDPSDELVEIYGKNRNFDFGGGILGDAGELTKRICFKLINRKMNEEILGQMPHRDFCDLAVIYFVLLDEEQMATMTVSNLMLECLGLDEEQLWNLAKENTPRLFSASTRNAGEVTRGCVNADCEMAYLTNTRGIFGSSVVLYDGILEKEADRRGGSYFLLPSSIHEWFTIPDKGIYSVEALADMVREINDEVVENTDVLSDHIYHYDRERGFVACTDGEGDTASDWHI